ncbi:hypothetical protein PV05_08555 [Exophiala xenobiotica]|uniref:Extracellular membrane protein CFEM domain-containing protein n=1 Tax=Exophiala xenobiotica TaxID=348802 RepID=A0A0D2EC83_9EURO|nr:uncharacterized protein PV05_08555 [Exophiala xenobiotica]KIW52948.1 hypothetical protein PV05_08555 [Exophiala xenobiotica]
MKPSLVLLPTFLFAVRALADVPPACLLSAVNTQDNPTDFSSLCGDEATDVQKAINSLCTSTNKSAAQSAFIATCSSAGSSVAPYTATSAATTTTPSGSFVYTTVVDGSTIVTSAGTSPTSGAGASATNSAGESAASATGNAASEQRQVGSFAAAVIAIAGVVAVL